MSEVGHVRGIGMSEVGDVHDGLCPRLIMSEVGYARDG